MVRKVPRELIQVEVEFPECLTKSSLAKVVTDLMKNLLHQRNQIPLQFDSITKDVKASEKVQEAENGMKVNEAVRPSREDVRNSRQAVRAAKNRAAYLKNGARLVKDVEDMADLIKLEVDKDDLVSISFMFGATPLSPREVYMIQLPQTSGLLQTNSRLGVHLFRAMVTHDQLHGLTSTRLPVSNMFILFCRSTTPPTSYLQMLPSYSLPPITRCPRVHFKISTLENEEDNVVPIAATRRLRFCSGASRLNPSIPESSPGSLHAGDVLESPDLLSPVRKGADIIRTEAVLRTSRKSELMDLCTPMVTRIAGPRLGPGGALETVELCTPQVTRAECTPLHVGMELCTPAVNLRTKFREQMDLCTPAVSMRTGDCMEACTPAFRTRVSDSMELCTPAIAKLEINGEAKEEIINFKEHEKDSGISSPDCSLGEEDFQEELFWFVTPSPVRGFK